MSENRVYINTNETYGEMMCGKRNTDCRNDVFACGIGVDACQLKEMKMKLWHWLTVAVLVFAILITLFY